MESFNSIKESYESVLETLEGDPQLVPFKDEFEKLYAALTKSHESEKKLMSKCRQLNAELVTAASKVQMEIPHYECRNIT